MRVAPISAATKCAERLRRSTRSRARAWIVEGPAWAIASLTFIGAFAIVGCGDAGPHAEETHATAEAIYGGLPDNDARQNQAVVSLKIGDATTFELCSAALIAPNVVLTARHCVSTNLTQSIACDSNGVSGNGDQVGADENPATIHVFLGASPDFRTPPAANGKAIFHPQTTVLCNSDMALLVLDRNINGVAPLKVRLMAATTTGEKVRSVGYGQNDKQLPTGTRLRKDDVGILAVGKTISTNQTALGTNEFEVGLSICQGDSGGPAISETTGAIVGVVSRGGNCTDDFGHIYTTLSGFAPVFQQAFALAGGAAVDESGMTPTAAPDAGAASDGGGTGASPADPTSNGRPPTTNLRAGAGNNCSASLAPASGQGVAALALAALGVFVARRRRR